MTCFVIAKHSKALNRSYQRLGFCLATVPVWFDELYTRLYECYSIK